MKVKVTLPFASVLTALSPIGFLPSFVPDGLEKNSTTKGSLEVLLSLPCMVVLAPTVLAEANSGLFCRPFGPESGSLASLAVAPAAFSVPPRRSMPRRPLEKIEFPETRHVRGRIQPLPPGYGDTDEPRAGSATVTDEHGMR